MLKDNNNNDLTLHFIISFMLFEIAGFLKSD